MTSKNHPPKKESRVSSKTILDSVLYWSLWIILVIYVVWVVAHDQPLFVFKAVIDAS